MNKKISLGAAILLIAVFAAATYAVAFMHARTLFNRTALDLQTREKMYDKLGDISKLVYENYAGETNDSKLMDAIARGYLEGIGDSYAQYYDAASYAAMQEESSGKIVQIGIVTGMGDDGYILVTEVYPESPASARGIKAGDSITKIDDQDVTKENYIEATELLRGEPGSTLQLEVLSDNQKSTVEVVRRAVEVPSLSASMIQDTSIGLIKFREFNRYTPDQFDTQMRSLMDQGAVGVIFDVRGVTNSTFDSVGSVLDAILPEGTIVSSTSKNGEDVVLKTSDNARQIQIPMAVLVNENTAGEAELFAQVIKDYNKGSIIGMKTKGRGTLQTIFNLSDGSAVEITTAVYIPPNGQPYDQDGVKPDYEVKLAEDLNNVSDLPLDSDLQMKKALEVVGAAVRGTGVDPNAVVSSEPESSQADSSDSNASDADSSGDSSDEDTSDASSDGTSTSAA